MNPIMFWLQGITMYRLTLLVLLVELTAALILSLVGVLPYDPASILLQTILFIGGCWGLNTVVAAALKIPQNVESSLITGLILSAIGGPLLLPRDWQVMAVMVVMAIGSKYLLTLMRSHVFNPAALGAVAAAVIMDRPASWWIGSGTLAPVIVVGGLVVMAKIRRWHLAGSFLGVYLGLTVLDALIIQGRGLVETGKMVQSLTFSGSLLFFIFVMLVEPLTAPQTKRRRVAFGALVGAVFFTLQAYAAYIPYLLELSLLAGNVFGRIIGPDWRQTFVLKKKELAAAAIGNFWFKPTFGFEFVPGQYLEYTLAHTRPDARGVRRFFSIASSPTEEGILLSARFSKPSSTFKQALQRMDRGDKVMAAKVAGDFVLPADREKKIAFIAGGIGVTPFRSMVKYLLDTKQTRDVVLLYGAREGQDLVFKEVFEAARQQFGMRTVYVLATVIDEKIIKKEIPDYNDRVFFISGPEPMVQSVKKVLIGMRVARRKIKRDYFPGYPEKL